MSNLKSWLKPKTRSKKTKTDKPKKRVKVLKPAAKSTAKKPTKVTGRGGKTVGGKANVTKEQLKASGLSLRQYMNQWDSTGKRPRKGAGNSKFVASPIDPKYRMSEKKMKEKYGK